MSAPLDIPVELPEQRRITVEEFHRMVEAGIIDEHEPVELLEGVLVTMPPIGDDHGWAVEELTRCLTKALPDGYRLRSQLPVILGRYSAPQPDLAISLVDPAAPRKHPRTALLAIEVSVTSLRYDRQAKAPVYARAGIAEYWIIDVMGRAVEVHTDPDAKRAHYRAVVRLGPDDLLQATSVPLPAIRVVDILP